MKIRVGVWVVFLFVLLGLGISAQGAVRFATGLSAEQNAATAAAEATGQLKTKLGLVEPDYIIICEDLGVSNINNVLNQIAAEYPGVPVYGRGDQWWDYDPYTEDGVSGVAGDQDGGLALLAVCGVDIQAEYVD